MRLASGLALCLAACTADNLGLREAAPVTEDGGADLAPQLATDLARPCAQTLAWAGAGDLMIRFQLRAEVGGRRTVIYQRAECSATADFWAVYLTAHGSLVTYMGGGPGGYATLASSAFVADGQMHTIAIARIDGALTLHVDGALAGTVAAPARLGALPPLGIATGDPCEMADGTRPMDGSVTDVCLSSEFP